MTLGRSNNLGFIKFVAALLVIFSHSFTLSVVDGGDILDTITNGQMSFGGLAVAIFLFASGLLVTRSLFRKPQFGYYFKQRIKRIFPPLIFVVLITAFILGPIITTLSAGEYFGNSQTYKYLLNGVCVLQHNLPGVFEGNAYDSTVNGALWTLPVEVLCYIACFIGYKIKLLNKKPFVVISIIAMAGWCYVAFFSSGVVMRSYRACLMFCFGALAFLFIEKIKMNGIAALLCIVAIVASMFTPAFNIVFVLAFPYLLLYVCWKLPQVAAKLGNLGNLSYGIYLVGCPIQQTVVYLNGGSMNPLINLVISIPVAIVVGLVVYLVAEKGFDKLISKKAKA